MKILLTTVSPTIDSAIDPRFGRGAYFLIVDPETLDWQADPNPAISASGGAGVQAAQFVVHHQCSTVISGDFGPNAYNALKEAGISMYQCGSSKTAREVIECFKSSQLEPILTAHSPGHKGHGRQR
jgi:predicted Fe-Mo cluster-binding NifX family protein